MNVFPAEFGSVGLRNPMVVGSGGREGGEEGSQDYFQQINSF